MLVERGFACVVILTLTAAIGLNTTLFTIYKALVLAPWPVAEAHRVVTIHNTSSSDVRMRGGGAPGGFSLDEIDYFRSATPARSLASPPSGRAAVIRRSAKTTRRRRG